MRLTRRRVATLAVALLVLLALGGVAAISWVFSSKLLVPDHELGPFGVEVEGIGVLDRNSAVRSELVTFERDEDSERRGIYGLDFEGGHAVAREVLRRGAGGVTRRVDDVRGPLAEKTRVAF